MLRTFLSFARGAAATPLGGAGVVLTTSSFVVFTLFLLLQLTGVITNTYVGLISFLALPTLFVIGLALIPIGWWRHLRRSGMTAREALAERFEPGWVRARLLGSRLFLWVIGLTGVNVLFLGVSAASTLRFMDEPRFCGTACHSVMSPEWATYQQSPHARVPCVDCHVGEGAGALIDSKLNGAWQLISVTLDLYERPIPTPVHQLRPARETCETCHWPEKHYGRRVETIRRYRPDRASSPVFTTLALEIGSGRGDRRGEIHWHVAAGNEVRYASEGDERERMLWVEVRRPGGRFERFLNRTVDAAAASEVRRLDCVDCHNRATHIYEDPARAIDERIASGAIDRSLPFAKRAAVGALVGSYPAVGGADAVEADFRGFYARDPELAPLAVDPRVDRAVAALRAIYERNVHRRMNVTWNPYPDHIGHRGGGGCFRCHSPDLVADSGRAIRSDCTLCHQFFAWEGDAPFDLLSDAPREGREAPLQRYLRRELLESLSPARAGTLP